MLFLSLLNHPSPLPLFPSLTPPLPSSLSPQGCVIVETSLRSYSSLPLLQSTKHRIFRSEHLRHVSAFDFQLCDLAGRPASVLCGRANKSGEGGSSGSGSGSGGRVEGESEGEGSAAGVGARGLTTLVRHKLEVERGASRRIVGFLEAEWVEREEEYLRGGPDAGAGDKALFVSKG